MKIVHISTSTKGGAGIAAYRLHCGLLEIGIDSVFVTLAGSNKDEKTMIYRSFKPSVLARILNRLGFPITVSQQSDNKLKRNKASGYEIYSFPESDFKDLINLDILKNATIINLHWVSGFIDYKSFFTQTKSKVVWTLHDMNPFQLGFHYLNDQVKYSQAMSSLEKKCYQIKKRAFIISEIHIVCPSFWLLNESSKSAFFKKFKHSLIPYGLPESIFKIKNQKFCRDALSINTDKKTFMIIAESLNNIRKGFDLLIDAFKLMSSYDFQVIAIGRKNDELSRFSFVQQLGYISEERLLALVYNSADAVILPSREDNLPNVMIEALCCGTPVIGFNIGGLKDAIQDGENGVLAQEVSASSLNVAINTFLQFGVNLSRESISQMAIENYSLKRQALDYKALYQSIC